VDTPGRNRSSGNPPLYCGRQHRSSRSASRSTPRIHPGSQPLSRERPYRKGSRHSRAGGPWHSLHRGLSTSRHQNSDTLYSSWRAPRGIETLAFAAIPDPLYRTMVTENSGQVNMGNRRARKNRMWRKRRAALTSAVKIVKKWLWRTTALWCWVHLLSFVFLKT
jgi:hypothetical protein